MPGLALSMDQEMGAIRAAVVVQLMKPGAVVVQLVESGAEQEGAPCGIATAEGFCPSSWDLDASRMVEEVLLVEVAVAAATQAGEEKQRAA